MGVDYYNCEICNEIFADAGHYGHCGKCEATLCGHCYDEMRTKNGELGEEHEKASWYGEEAPNCCDVCDGTVIDETEFINFLVKKIGSTREELEIEFKKEVTE
jgi:hypothetical protein